MGAAKNRKAEIMQLKATGPRFGTKYVSMGCFFKADEDHGFSVHFDQKTTGVNIDKLTKLCVEKATGYDEHMLPDFPSKQHMADWLLGQSLELCDQINFGLYGTEIQPKYGTKVVKDITPEIGNISILIMNVIWLERNGFLTSDNYNGMMYGSV